MHYLLYFILTLDSLVTFNSNNILVFGSLPTPTNPCVENECQQPDFLGQTRSFTLPYIRQICGDLHDDMVVDACQ